MSSLIASLPLVPTAAQIRSEQLPLTTLVQQVGQRIATHDPDIQALLPETGRQERLLSEATALQQRFPDPATRPSLYGILFAVKDLFGVDGFATQAGLKLPPELFAGPQASCVTKLCEAGALFLAKTMTTEAAYFEPAPTRNPHNLAHTPGGSSSGSAAAIAAGFCSLALGTQTIGSVIRPAAFCGIVGFKPTYGRIPTDGLIPCAPSLDTIGFFTPDIAGVEPVASLLCTHWRAATASSLPVLGVPDGPYLDQASAEALTAFQKQITLLEEAGYTVRHEPALSDIHEVNYRHRRLVFAEMAQSHATWFAPYQSLYRPRTAQAILEGQTVGFEELAIAHAGRAQLRAEVETLMTREQIDLWICPAAPGPAPEGIASTGDPVMNLPWTHAGLPALALPVGHASNGLPLGLQLVGAYMNDEQLVAWATQMAKILS